MVLTCGDQVARQPAFKSPRGQLFVSIGDGETGARAVQSLDGGRIETSGMRECGTWA
jgi:hypothetical protein